MQLTQEIRAILESGRIEGFSYFLPSGKLERKIYEQANKVLTNAGGKWNKKSQCHVFDCDPSQSLGLTFKTGVSRNRKLDALKMKPETFNKLHTLRMENDAAKYAMDEMRPRFDRMKGRHENGTAPRAVVAYQLFQTPAAVASQLVALLDLNQNCKVLEPSAGLGRILDAIAPFARDVVAVEMAANIAGELYLQERPEVKILQRDFLSVSPSETGQFDAVAMNPPFHLRDDIKHIRHALTFVKPGGRLAALCLNTHHRATAFKAMASQWIELEPGAFKESGTNVGVIMMLIEV